MSSKFIIFGTGRCGSTMLTTSLRQHPELKMFGEIFNRHAQGVDQSLFDEFYPYDILDTDSHKKVCTKKVCIKAHEKYDGFKLLFGHVHNDIEEYLKETKVVLLQRSPFKTAVSSLVADMTNVYLGREEFEGTIHIPLQTMENRIAHTLKRVAYFKQYSDLTIKYEDDFQENYNKICDLINVSRFTPKVSTIIRIARPMCDVIENYEEIQHLDKEYEIY